MSTDVLSVSDHRWRPEIQAASLNRSIRGPVRLGLTLAGLFVLAFGTWGATAPLAGGAIAPALISPDGNRKTVQHLEGGIIQQLRVRDGDVIKAGQPLLAFEAIQARATYEALLDQYLTLLASRARLLAEQTDSDRIDWPAELQKTTGREDLRAIVDGQSRIFATRRATHAARKGVLRQRIEQLREQIGSLEAQVQSASIQLKLIDEEVSGKEELWRKAILPKPEVLRLRRAQAEIMGKRGEYVGLIARAREQIGETELQLLALDAERTDEIATQLNSSRAELTTVRERLHASEDILNRTVVVAPVSGTVINLRFKTRGGVVHPGEPIMDIVPAEDTLLIDARVSPNDIDVVHVGLTAKIHLLAFASRRTPQIDGVVQSVSADRLIDEQTKQPYYLARVEVDLATLKRTAPEINLVPGMPAEVLIVTGERTLFEYLSEPLLDVIRRSFREV